MKIVIKIPDKLYEYIVKGKDLSEEQNDEMALAIADGMLLPEHHGRLIDIDKIDDDRMESDNPIIELTTNREYIEAVSLDYLNSLPTIIEADKESEEE